MAAFSAEISLKAKARKVGDGDLGDPAVEKEIEALLQFVSGTVADAADIIYADDFSIAASSTGDLDLAGVLTDAFGAVITAAEIVAIIVKAHATNTNNVVVGGASATQVPVFSDVTDKIPVKPGGFFVIAAPNASGQATVTAGTGDKLGLANSGAGSAVTGEIWILARTA